MTTHSNDKPVSKPLRLSNVRDISKRPGYGPFTPGVVRHLIFNAEDRVGSGGAVVPGNGLGPAIIRIGRKILIDLDAFDDWVESHREVQ